MRILAAIPRYGKGKFVTFLNHCSGYIHAFIVSIRLPEAQRVPMVARIAIAALVVVLVSVAGLVYLAETSSVPTRLVEKQVPDDALPH